MCCSSASAWPSAATALGWIDFNDYALARTVGIVALALILFEGGLAAGFPEIRPVLGPALTLAILGTLITAAVTGLVAAWLFDFDTTEGLLVGAIVAGTDGAAIFALLRGSTLRRRLARTLEGESGMNDPIAILLVLGFIEKLMHPDYGVVDFAWLFVAADRDRRRRRPRRRLRLQLRAARGAAGDRRASTRSPRWPRPRSPSASPTPRTAPASWRSTWPA